MGIAIYNNKVFELAPYDVSEIVSLDLSNYIRENGYLIVLVGSTIGFAD